MKNIKQINKEVIFNGKTYQFKMKDDFKQINVISGLPLDEILLYQLFSDDLFKSEDDGEYRLCGSENYRMFKFCDFDRKHYTTYTKRIEDFIHYGSSHDALEAYQLFYFTQNWECLQKFKEVLAQPEHLHLQEHFTYSRLAFFPKEYGDKIFCKVHDYQSFSGCLEREWEIR